MLGTGMKVSLSPYTAHGAPARQASRISLSKACEKLRQKLRSSSNSIHGYGQRRTRCKQHSSPNLRLYSENPQSARRAPRRSSDSDNTQHASDSRGYVYNNIPQLLGITGSIIAALCILPL